MVVLKPYSIIVGALIVHWPLAGLSSSLMISVERCGLAVSYTHLDVYKRQTQSTTPTTDPSTPPPGTPETTPPTETKPKSFFGNVKLTKTGENAAGETAKLAGASFQVYRCTSATQLGDMIDGFSGTTNANGELFITGLQANNYQNGAVLDLSLIHI